MQLFSLDTNLMKKIITTNSSFILFSQAILKSLKLSCLRFFLLFLGKNKYKTLQELYTHLSKSIFISLAHLELAELENAKLTI